MIPRALRRRLQALASPPPLRRLLPWLLPRLTVGPLFALLLLTLAEIALRLSGAPPAWTAQHGIGWRLSADLSGPMPVLPGQDPFTVRTNADGLRTDLPRARPSSPDALPRVALMGDSTVFGWGADEGGTPADGLRLGLADLGVQTEILNAGQPGYSTVQAAWLYREVIHAYAPDLLIYVPSLHDHNGVLISDALLLQQREADTPTPGADTSAKLGIGPRSRLWLIQESRLYQLLRQRLFSLSAQPLLSPNRAEADRMPRVSDAERAAALLSLQAALQARGAALAIGYLPQALDLDRAPDRRAPRLGEPWMDAFRAAHAIPAFDARACCVGRRDLLLPKDPGHLTAEGNLLAGRALAAAIYEAGYAKR